LSSSSSSTSQEIKHSINELQLRLKWIVESGATNNKWSSSWWYLRRRQLDVSSLPRSANHFVESFSIELIIDHISASATIETISVEFCRIKFKMAHFIFLFLFSRAKWLLHFFSPCASFLLIKLLCFWTGQCLSIIPGGVLLVDIVS